jgi:hypothetical protein
MFATRRLVAAAIAVGGAAVLAVPALAGPFSPLRSSGPTTVHDANYAGVQTEVHVVNTGDGKTLVTLHASGFPESSRNKTHGAHVHAKACGANTGDSGGHYQNPTPAPDDTLAEKEIWLDLAINSAGRGSAQAIAPWTINPGDAGSVVIHLDPTNPQTGGAAARLLCTTVPFSS